MRHGRTPPAPGHPPARATLEVGPGPVLAGAVVEAALGGAIAHVTHTPHAVFPFSYDVSLTDRRTAIVRIGLPEDRQRLARAARESDRLRALGVEFPHILARDLTSEFPYLIQANHQGTRLATTILQAGKAEIGRIAGALAEIQEIVSFSGNPANEHRHQNERHQSSWSSRLARRCSAYGAVLDQSQICDRRFARDCLERIEALAATLDALPSVTFLPGPFLSQILVTAHGGILFGDMASPLIGDARFAPARLLAELALAQYDELLAEAWLLLSGEKVDAIFNLYAAINCLAIAAEQSSPVAANSIAVRRRYSKDFTMRLENLLRRFLPLERLSGNAP